MKYNILSQYWGKYGDAVKSIMLPGDQSKVRDISYWRDIIFCHLLIYLVPLSIVALVPGVYMSILSGHLIIAAVDLITFGSLIAIMVLRSLHMYQRKFAFIIIFYCLSIVLLYYVSTLGAGMLFLLMLTVITSVIYSPGAAYYTAVANTVICSLFGVLIHFGAPIFVDTENKVGAWVAISSNLVLLSFASAGILNLLLKGMGTTIDDRIAAEKELKDTYDRLRFHIDNGPLGYVEWDSAFRVKSWSKRSEAIFGWSEKEHIESGRNGYMQVYDDDLPLVHSIGEQLISGGVVNNTVQHRNYRKDGTVIWCEWFNSVLPDKDGNVDTIVSLVKDITERKKTEAELQRSNRLYNFISAINQSIVHIKDEGNLLDHVCEVAIGIGKFKIAWIGMLDHDGKLNIDIVHGDPAAKEVIQKYSGMDFYSPDLANTPTGRVLHTGEYAVSNNINNDPSLQKWRTEQILYDVKTNISLPIKKFGKIVGVFGLSSSLEHFFDIQEIGLLLEAVGDISFAMEIFENDRIRVQAVRQLQQSEVNLSAIIENTDAHIYSIDREFKYLTFNTLLKQTIHQAYQLDIHVGDKVFGFLERLAPEEAREWEDVYRQAFTGKSMQFVKEFDFNSAKSYTSFSINPIWEKNVVIGLSCFARDITSQKLAEAEIVMLNESLEKRVEERTAELQKVNNELEAFSYTVSHDLQSPLRVLSGFTKILLTDYKDNLDEEGSHFLEIIDSSARRMSRLIHDLLQFSKLGKEELAVGAVDMHELIYLVMNELRFANAAYEKAEINLLDVPPCICDHGLMRQVWSNLIGNALKYSSKKEHIVIEIGVRTIDGQHVYYIKDNGVGFDMKYAGKLFAVFQRMHMAEDFEGTGVGLATVDRIITKHGGRIWAESKKDEGAIFYFTLGGAN